MPRLLPLFTIAGAALSLSACATPMASGRSIAELVASHTEARGGAAAIEAVRGVDLALEIVEPQFTLDGRYASNRQGCMRIDAFMQGQHAVSEGISSSGGWAANGGAAETRPQPEQGEVQLLHGIENPTRLIGLHEFASRGHRLVYDGPVTLGGERFEKITATYRDGYRAELYLDPQSLMIERMREVKPMHFEHDPTEIEIETRFSDFRTVNGVVYPFLSHEVNWKTGKELGVTTVRSIVVDSPFALAACSDPELPITPPAGD